jgi:hypothetical protein
MEKEGFRSLKCKKAKKRKKYLPFGDEKVLI